MLWSLPIVDEFTIGRPPDGGNRGLCLSQPAPGTGQLVRFLNRLDAALGTPPLLRISLRLEVVLAGRVNYGGG